MARFCPSCGTEVDDTAVFCPTCGQAIDQSLETEIPPAPAWPERAEDTPPPPPPARAYEVPPQAASPQDRPFAPRAEEPTRTSPAPDADLQRVPPPPPSGPPPPESSPRSGPSLPVTMPVMLSGWLIGGGALVGAIGALAGLFTGAPPAIDLLLLLVLAGIGITVFFAASVPEIANLRLATLAVVLVGFGVALDRIFVGLAGVGTLLLLMGTAGAAIGAIILELGRDQPLGGPQP